MKKIWAIMIVFVLIAGMAACEAKPKQDTPPLSKDETSQMNEDGAQGDENDQKTGENTSEDGQAAYSGGSVEGLPQGFPQSVPFYQGAQLLEADAYGDNGFTVIYMVNAPYESVVAFYMQAIAGLDESGIGDDEAYFESMDLDDGVHINGLTISDADGTTQVFITLKADAGDMTDDASYDGEEDINETEGDYDNIVGGVLEDGYPQDVVPVYETLKITTSSKTPDNDLYVLEGVAPPDSFDDALAFYQGVFGDASKSFESPVMKTEEFSGERDGWSYTVYVADIATSGNTVIQISLQK